MLQVECWFLELLPLRRGVTREVGRGGDNQDDAYKLCDLNEEQQRAKANAAGSLREGERGTERGGRSERELACVIEQVNAGGSCRN